MFREIRLIAQLHKDGMTDAQVMKKVMEENLFQYPTERETKGKCRVALRRFGLIKDSETLVDALAEGPLCEARQAALVAMMCDTDRLRRNVSPLVHSHDALRATWK